LTETNKPIAAQPASVKKVRADEKKILRNDMLSEYKLVQKWLIVRFYHRISFLTIDSAKLEAQKEAKDLTSTSAAKS
jgi:hypothetical protein